MTVWRTEGWGRDRGLPCRAGCNSKFVFLASCGLIGFGALGFRALRFGALRVRALGFRALRLS